MTHQKQRLELFIERLAAKRAGRILEEAGLTGYTMLPTMAGYGGETRWQRDIDISATREMVVIISIGDEDVMEKALEQLGNLLGSHIGVLSVSTVTVLRPGRF